MVEKIVMLPCSPPSVAIAAPVLQSLAERCHSQRKDAVKEYPFIPVYFSSCSTLIQHTTHRKILPRADELARRERQFYTFCNEFRDPRSREACVSVKSCTRSMYYCESSCMIYKAFSHEVTLRGLSFTTSTGYNALLMVNEINGSKEGIFTSLSSDIYVLVKRCGFELS